MPDLGKILEDSRPAIQAGLREAQQELAALEDRKRELEGLIARARAALGELELTSGDVNRTGLKLHEAMELVLSGSPSKSMTARGLAREINERGLYERRDRSSIEPNQIHARAGSKSYAHLFSKKDGVVTLRASS